MGINPLVVARLDDQKSAWAGIYLAEDVLLLKQGFEDGSWIDGVIGGFGVSMDALGLLTDPLGTVTSWGVAWLIEHVRPLSEALDWLAGDPAQIGAYAATWTNLGRQLAFTAADYRIAVSRQVGTWEGAAGSSYRNHAGEQYTAIDGLAEACHTMATITSGAAMLVSLVRTMIRDLIADFVSVLAVRLWEWIAEEAATLGLGTPLVIAQVSALVGRWADKITQLIRGLINSIRRLMPILRSLEELIKKLRTAVRRLLHKGPAQSHTPHEPRPPHYPAHPDFSNPDIGPSKISGYALNSEHPVGGNKYRVINSATGLGPEDAAKVEAQIREGVRNGTVVLGKADQYGQRYNIDMPLTGPKGTIIVRTAWIIDAGSTTPRLVTISFPN
jgi:hypothetical protein